MAINNPLPLGPINDTATARAVLAPAFDGLPREELHVLHLDSALRPVKRTVTRDQRLAAVDLPVRDILRDALALESRALLLAHNHPSGDPSPSRADKAATRRLASLAHPLGIRIVDHLVFAGDSFFSFRANGLL